jgi:hypothetical protein
MGSFMEKRAKRTAVLRVFKALAYLCTRARRQMWEEVKSIKMWEEVKSMTPLLLLLDGRDGALIEA